MRFHLFGACYVAEDLGQCFVVRCNQTHFVARERLEEFLDLGETVKSLEVFTLDLYDLIAESESSVPGRETS